MHRSMIFGDSFKSMRHQTGGSVVFTFQSLRFLGMTLKTDLSISVGISL